ncbi:M16 family metallopeptidase [Propionibacteriaceae bacterium G1746]
MSTTITPRTPRPGVTHGHDWRFPLPEVVTLSNGLTVWLFNLPGQHVAALDLMMPIALDAEPRALEGLAGLTLHTSDEGTVPHPDGRISELLENVGAAYDGRTANTHTFATLDVPTTRFAEALPLFAEILAQPELSDESVERHKALRVAEIEQALVSGAHTANMATRALRWQAGTRASRMLGGSRETVAALTPDDVRGWHAGHWGPDASTVVVAGDFVGQDPLALLEATLGQWQVATAPRVASSEDQFAELPSTRVVRLVDRPGAVQIDLRIAGVGVDRHDPDWAALQVASVAVGGSFLSRLNKVLREELGYTYGIHLAATPQASGGVWAVSANVRNDVAVDALDQTLKLLDLSANPLTQAEVDDAINQVVGLAPLRYDTAEAIVGQATTLATAGVDADQVNRHHAALRQVSAEQATAAHQRIIGAERGHVVVVGDAAQLAGPLQQAGYDVQPFELDA